MKLKLFKKIRNFSLNPTTNGPYKKNVSLFVLDNKSHPQTLIQILILICNVVGYNLVYFSILVKFRSSKYCPDFGYFWAVARLYDQEIYPSNTVTDLEAVNIVMQRPKNNQNREDSYQNRGKFLLKSGKFLLKLGKSR